MTASCKHMCASRHSPKRKYTTAVNSGRFPAVFTEGDALGRFDEEGETANSAFCDYSPFEGDSSKLTACNRGQLLRSSSVVTVVHVATQLRVNGTIFE